MKNFKIYSDAKKTKKMKLVKKIKYTIAAGIIIVPLISCIKVHNRIEERKEYLRNPSIKNEQFIDEPNVIEIDNNATKKIISGNYKTINFEIDNKSFNNYIDSIETYYEGEEKYNINENYNQIKSLNIKKHHDVENINLDELKDIVKNNNKNYIKKDEMTGFYKELDDKDLNKVMDIVIKTLKYYDNNEYVDKERLNCILKDLKVFKDSQLSNAYISNDNCLVINPDMIKVLQDIHPESDAFTNTITHEAVHLMQKNCLHKSDKVDYNIGLSYKFKDTKNSMNYSWFYEASAELNTMEIMNSDSIVYTNMVNYLESMNLSNSLNPQFKSKHLKSLSFTNDPDNLLNYFNQLDKNEVLKIMYALEIMQKDDKDFLDTYNGNVDDLKFSLKASVCETMTKNFYKNLANQKNIDLNTAFYMITLFENDLNVHLKYYDEGRYEQNKEFMKKYLEIQDAYFNCIKLDNVEELFENYGVNLENNKENYDLSVLNKDTNIYLLKTQKRVNYISASPIRDYNNSYTKEVRNK